MSITTKALQRLDPERAHVLSIKALKMGLHPRMKADVQPNLAIKVFGLDFPNPFGIAAGFDKHGEAIKACHGMGLGFAEIGSVTPKPQAGNPKPRVFRIPKQQAVINRYGFNSEGHKAVAKRLERWRHNPSGILGVNLGKNKETENAVEDYLLGIKTLARFADYVVVNVSSPNTPGLRGEQAPERLEPLLSQLKAELSNGKSLVLKVAPDLDDQDISDISRVVRDTGTDALMVSNTTLARPQGCDINQAGGLSGVPLFEPSTQILKAFAHELKGAVHLIGVGGVASADQAYEKIRSGASLVQFYSALTYGGHPMIREIITGVSERLKRDGFDSVQQAVGADLST